MKLLIDIPEAPLYRDMYTAICENEYIFDEDNEYIAKTIKNGTPIPDNATFGDVIEKITNRKPLEDNKDADNIIISTKLWNAPYQKGGKT